MNLIEEINLVGIFDAGIPNAERVVLQANAQVDLGTYCIIVAFKQGLGLGNLPLRDHFFWLGNMTLNPGDWVFLYTSPGTAQSHPLPNGPGRLVSMYWGKPQTIFQDKNLTAGLISVETARFPVELPQAPQLGHHSGAIQF